jgi:sporulation-control protein spo0M
MYANLARKGYAPGEHIALEVHIVNESPVKVRARVTLYQTRVFLSRNRHHAIEEHFEQIEGAVVQKAKDHMETLLVPVPDDTPLTMKTTIIVIKYFVHITLDIPRQFDAHINLPVAITTKRALADSRSL